MLLTILIAALCLAFGVFIGSVLEERRKRIRDRWPWREDRMRCTRCGCRWEAEHEDCERVQCPMCGYLEQVPPRGDTRIKV